MGEQIFVFGGKLKEQPVPTWDTFNVRTKQWLTDADSGSGGAAAAAEPTPSPNFTLHRLGGVVGGRAVTVPGEQLHWS